MIFKYSPRSLDPTGNRKIPLGKQGENKRMTLVFDVREWMDEYPEAELAVYVKPPEGEAYLAGIDKEQKGVYRWEVLASDTAKAGEGMIELVMRDEATGTVHKSITAKTMILPSISAEAPGEIPEAHVPWWERALKLIEIGVSPEVVVTEIEGGHRVEITDEKGLHAFDVMDGEDANKNLLDGDSLNSLRMKEATVSHNNAIALNAATASGAYAHAEGYATASGYAAHAEGRGEATGNYSHAEGMYAVASKNGSHAEGFQTISASKNQHVQGKCNVEDSEERYAHIVGNGKDIHNRSNAHTLDWNGNAWYQGDVYVGGNSQDDAEKLVKESAIPEVIEDALAQAKESGEFNGTDGNDGYTPVKGVDYFDGKDGAPGEDGFSPTVTLTRESDGVTIKATNKSGTSTAKVYDGKDGAGGGTGGGLPTGEAPYQQLVTDADGNAVWEDKPFYEEIVEGDVLPETTVAFDPDAGGMGYVTEPYASYPTAENVYTVYWNGTPYECVAGDIEADGVPSVGLGNLAVFGGTETDDPFALVFVPRDVAESYGGIYCIAVDLSGASSATVRVAGTVSVIHPIDSKFIQSAKNSSIVNGSAIGSLRTIGSYAEDENYTMGTFAFAEGVGTKAGGEASHAEGSNCEASGTVSHVEGISCGAHGTASHAEGGVCNAGGDYSHAEGYSCQARAASSHAEGSNTIAASPAQHVRGRNNIVDGSGRYSTIVGNGAADKASNAHTLDWHGNAWFAGKVYVGGTSQDDATELGMPSDKQIENAVGKYLDENPVGGGGSGMPAGSEPYQQLVTDVDGTAKWGERTHYDELHAVLPRAEGVWFEDGSMFVFTTPLERDIIPGKTYILNCNGVDYECPAFEMPINEENGELAPVVGNPVAFGGDDNGAPILLIAVPPEPLEGVGEVTMLGMPIPMYMTELTAVVSITGRELVKLDHKYIDLSDYYTKGESDANLEKRMSAAYNPTWESEGGSFPLGDRPFIFALDKVTYKMVHIDLDVATPSEDFEVEIRIHTHHGSTSWGPQVGSFTVKVNDVTNSIGVDLENKHGLLYAQYYRKYGHFVGYDKLQRLGTPIVMSKETTYSLTFAAIGGHTFPAGTAIRIYYA